jgi:DNA polymerase I-like protein with 3'-5' exonuclease and polymerase domains
MTWNMAAEFPDLSPARRISIDLETYDPDLKKKGPGVRRNGYIIGVAVGTDDGFRQYYPIRHEKGPNLVPESVMRWLRVELAGEQDKVGTNLLYDADYLASEGVFLGGRWLDIQVAEPLLDENRLTYSLDSLAQKWLGETKIEDTIEKYASLHGWKGKAQRNLWRMPVEIVGPYAERDVDLPLRIMEKQLIEIEHQELTTVFDMECRLTKLLLKMRRTGVKIDVSRLDQTIDKVKNRLDQLHRELRSLAGSDVNVWAADSIAKVFDREGLEYPRTIKQKRPSFTAIFLERHPHPLAKKIVEVRKLDKFLGTFLIGSLKESLIGDRIHCLFHQLKGDVNGTVTGRFSSAQPNLQFIPARDEELGPMCRSLFLPEDDCDWGKADESQVEFRLFAHYAEGQGSEEVRRKYNENPDVDFHAMCAEMAGIERKPAKSINFGKIYGMGLDKLCQQLGFDKTRGKKFMSDYDEAIPFVSHMLALASSVAQKRGYVRTILGRRRRFDVWEPVDWSLSKIISAKPKEVALKLVEEAVKMSPAELDKIYGISGPIRPGIRRAGTYRALNAVIQGSAAEIMKKAMVDCYENGIFDVLPLHLTVHDELDVSRPRTKEAEEAFLEMIRIMETTIPLKVPLRVDWKIGPNWGAC